MPSGEEVADPVGLMNGARVAREVQERLHAQLDDFLRRLSQSEELAQRLGHAIRTGDRHAVERLTREESSYQDEMEILDLRSDLMMVSIRFCAASIGGRGYGCVTITIGVEP
jgi:hypothetical protein